ncbi:MAG: FecR domain-containing protein, partial [Armatimonadetes bacterium]|nr:FecR domain-containing protein [Armatimonadota bacterium]
AEPVQWHGSGQKVTLQLFVDGQRATGTFQGVVVDGFLQGELIGSGSGTQYSGTLKGTVRLEQRTFATTGRWTSTVPASGEGSASISWTGRAGGTMRANVLLKRGAAVTALQVTHVRGTVTRRSGSGAPSPVTRGQTLKVGDTVQTAALSSAIVTLGDRSVVLLQENSIVTVPAVPANQSGIQRAQAQSGKIWFAVQKSSTGARFDVEAGDVVAAVRGTEFVVEIGEDDEVSLTTAEGRVEMEDPSGREASMRIESGQQFRRLGRRLRRPGIWAERRAAMLDALADRWGDLLDEADNHFPQRRMRGGPGPFWQDRFRRTPGQPGPGGPGAGPRPPGPGGTRPGPRQGPGRRPGGRRPDTGSVSPTPVPGSPVATDNTSDGSAAAAAVPSSESRRGRRRRAARGGGRAP